MIADFNYQTFTISCKKLHQRFLILKQATSNVKSRVCSFKKKEAPSLVWGGEKKRWRKTQAGKLKQTTWKLPGIRAYK